MPCIGHQKLSLAHREERAARVGKNIPKRWSNPQLKGTADFETSYSNSCVHPFSPEAVRAVASN